MCARLYPHYLVNNAVILMDGFKWKGLVISSSSISNYYTGEQGDR